MPQPTKLHIIDYLRPFVLFLLALSLMYSVGAMLQSAFGLHLGLIVSEVAVVLLPAWFYRRLQEGRKVAWPRMDRTGLERGTLVLVIVAAMAIALWANVMGGLFVEFVPALKTFAEHYQKVVDKLMLGGGTTQQVLGAISVSIAAPLCEEFMFRGTILPEQRRTEPFVVAIVVNGLLFALIHGNPIAFIPLWVIGTFLAHLTVKTGALWPAIISHCTINTLNGVILPRVAPALATPKSSTQEMLITAAVLTPIAAGLWAIVGWRLVSKRRAS